MSVEKGEEFRSADVFVDYDFEDVKFRWDYRSRKVFRKFHGETEENEVPFDNRLFNDALRFGDRITPKAYFDL